jgi:hypothetical protein
MTGTTASLVRQQAQAWRQVAGEHLPLTAVISTYVLAGLLAERVFRIPGMMEPLAYTPTYAYFLVVAAYSAVVLLVWCRWQVRGPAGERLEFGPGWREAWALFARRFGTVERAGGFVVVSLLLPLFINTTLCWKAAIPKIQPFGWDHQLMRADLMLHFGVAPWQWLQPLLGHPDVTTLMDLLYYLWIPFVTGLVYWQAWSPHRAQRMRFFLTYTVGWILLGTVVATLLSSAGPCFYGAVTGTPSPYAPLMAYLQGVDRSHSLISLEVQRILLHEYEMGRVSPWNAISAMPSIHVAMPVVFTMLAWQRDRVLGAAFAVFGAVVFLGSVHLGWHYAVDGYVSVLTMIAVWRAAGWFVTRYLGADAAGRAAA